MMDECGKGRDIFFIFHSFLFFFLLLLLWFCFIWILGFFLVSSPLSSEFVLYSNGLRRASNHGSPSLCGHNNRPTHQQQLIAAAGQSEPTVFLCVYSCNTTNKKNLRILSFILELVDDICIIPIASNTRKRSWNISFSFIHFHLNYFLF